MDKATQGVLTVATSVLEQLEVEAVLERVLEAARDLTGARYAALGVLDESRSQLARFLTLGIDEPTRRCIGPLPTGRGVLGELISDPRPLRLADVSRHPHSYGFPVGHPPMHSFLGVPIMIGEQPYGNLYLTDKQDAAEFTVEDEQTTVLLAQFAALAIDHASRYSRSESERLRLQHTVTALDATIQISRALAGQTDLAAILELVAKRGRALVSARALVIERVHGAELELAAGAGELPGGLVGRRVPLAGTVAGVALRAGATQRLSDEATRARFDRHGLGRVGVTVENGIVVPLVFRERAYGALLALDRLDRADFTAEDQRLLESFAASAAAAMATAQSAADERRRQAIAAAEAERGRWARELHDETLQALGSLRLLLSGAHRSDDPKTMAGAIAGAVEQLELDITTLRALIAELRPAALDQLGLEPALLALVDRVRRSGLEIDARVELGFQRGDDSARLAPELETGIYRVAQEALTNAVKHGHAARAIVEVIEDAGRVTVLVRDDGVGFDPSAGTDGFGLAGMRERVELLSGELTVDSAPDEGTTIDAVLPVLRRPTLAASPLADVVAAAE